MSLQTGEGFLLKFVRAARGKGNGGPGGQSGGPVRVPARRAGSGGRPEGPVRRTRSGVPVRDSGPGCRAGGPFRGAGRPVRGARPGTPGRGGGSGKEKGLVGWCLR